MTRVLSLDEIERLYTTAEERLRKGDKITVVVREFAALVEKESKSISNCFYTNKRFKNLRDQYCKKYKTNSTTKSKDDLQGPKKRLLKNSQKLSLNKREYRETWLPHEDEFLVSQIDEMRTTGLSTENACEQIYTLFDRVPRTALACKKRYEKLRRIQKKQKQDSIPDNVPTQPLLRLIKKLPAEGEEVLQQLSTGINGLRSRIRELERELAAANRNRDTLDRDHKILINEHDQLKTDHSELAKVFRGIKKLMHEAFGEDVVPDHHSFVQEKNGNLSVLK